MHFFRHTFTSSFGSIKAINVVIFVSFSLLLDLIIGFYLLNELFGGLPSVLSLFGLCLAFLASLCFL